MYLNLKNVRGRYFLFWLVFFGIHPAFAAIDEVVMTVWVDEAIVATRTYNDENYLTHQRELAKYFTAAAWIDYNNALLKANLREIVTKNKYSVSAIPLAPPVIKSLGPNAWRATMPLLVQYKNKISSRKQTLEVVLNFTKAGKGKGVRGFEISSIYENEVPMMCTCKNLNPE